MISPVLVKFSNFPIKVRAVRFLKLRPLKYIVQYLQYSTKLRHTLYTALDKISSYCTYIVPLKLYLYFTSEVPLRVVSGLH